MEDYNAIERKKSLINILEGIINTVNDDSFIVKEYSIDMENHVDDYYGIPIQIKGRTYKLNIKLEL